MFGVSNTAVSRLAKTWEVTDPAGQSRVPWAREGMRVAGLLGSKLTLSPKGLGGRE